MSLIDPSTHVADTFFYLKVMVDRAELNEMLRALRRQYAALSKVPPWCISGEFMHDWRGSETARLIEQQCGGLVQQRINGFDLGTEKPWYCVNVITENPPADDLKMLLLLKHDMSCDPHRVPTNV